MDMPLGPAVVLTREPEDNFELAQSLRRQGVPVREIPCLATRLFRPEKLPSGPFDALAFTSRRGVWGFVQQDLASQFIFKKLGGTSTLKVPLVAAVGTRTATELEQNGISVDITADPPEGRRLAQLLIQKLRPDARVGVVRGNLRAGGMDQELDQAGLKLDPIVVYENIEPEIPVLEPFRVAAIFVASPSAAKRLLDKNPWMTRATFFTIGSTTSGALRQKGIESVVELGPQPEHWTDALLRAYHQALGSG